MNEQQKELAIFNFYSFKIVKKNALNFPSGGSPG